MLTQNRPMCGGEVDRPRINPGSAPILPHTLAQNLSGNVLAHCCTKSHGEASSHTFLSSPLMHNLVSVHPKPQPLLRPSGRLRTARGSYMAGVRPCHHRCTKISARQGGDRRPWERVAGAAWPTGHRRASMHRRQRTWELPILATSKCPCHGNNHKGDTGAAGRPPQAQPRQASARAHTARAAATACGSASPPRVASGTGHMASVMADLRRTTHIWCTDIVTGDRLEGMGRIGKDSIAGTRRNNPCEAVKPHASAPQRLQPASHFPGRPTGASPTVGGAQDVHNCSPSCKQTCRQAEGAGAAPNADTCAPPGARWPLQHEAPKPQHLQRS